MTLKTHGSGRRTMDMGSTQNLDAPAHRAESTSGTANEISTLLQDFAVEVTADEVLATEHISALIPPGTQVYLPLLPNRTLAESVPAAERLAREGMIPVPHIAARRLASESELSETLERMREVAGVTSALVIAGDTNDVTGPYAGSLDLLESGLLERAGITNIGIAGYPEPHPLIAPPVIWETLRRKCSIAASSSAEFRIVSQFTFSSQSVIDWVDELRQNDVTLPVTVSVPGPAKLRTLLAYARRCGVSTSLRQLTRNRKAILGLATVSAPDQVITGLARHKGSSPDSAVAGVLFNVFGGFEETAGWIRAAQDGRIAMNRGGTGFTIERE